jgi:uncharacterized membrane protein YgcG
LLSSATLALAGTATLATGWIAEATPGDPHQVWVCKYVQTPHTNEVLKAGKNPIFVDWASLTGREDAPHVGDTFSDAHDKSVVVQIGGSSPGTGACIVSTPPTTPPTTAPTTPPTTPPPTTPSDGGGGGGGGNGGGGGGNGGGGGGGGSGGGGGNGGLVPGVGAPDTGGAGGTSPVNGLVGSGLLLAAAGLLAGDVRSRRRQAGQA